MNQSTDRQTDTLGGALHPIGTLRNTRNFGCGLNMLRQCGDGLAAAAVFDPQYRGVLDKLALGNEGARQKKRALLKQMPEEVIATFLSEIARVLCPSGHLFLWVDKFHLAEGVGPWVRGAGLEMVDYIVWNKGVLGMGYRSRRVSEFVVVAQKPPVRAKDIWADRAIRDVVEEKVEAPRSGHPHKKPVQLQARLLGAVTRPGDVIIDPAAGSFSSMESCALLDDRIYYGTDLIDAREMI